MSGGYVNPHKLHYAAEYNRISHIKQWLAQGVDVDVKDEYHRTPLYFLAVQNEDDSHFEAAEVLLNQGADANARDNEGITPFRWLVVRANMRMIKLFLSFDADVSALNNYGENNLFSAIFNRNLDVLQWLIDFGLNVNQRSLRDGKTPLHWAYGNVKVIKCLLNNGADNSAVDSQGGTPLIQALESHDFNRMEFQEKMKKNLIFIINHSDFNIVPHDVNILLDIIFLDKPQPQFLWKMILKHVSKLQTLNIPVYPDLFNFVPEQDEHIEYYNLCKEELSRAISTKLKNSWLTFYNLLVDNRKKLKNYAGNQDLIEDFEKSDCEEKFPIYGASMIENVKKGIKRRELFDKSVNLLSDSLPIFNPTHLIIRDILDCVMSMKDLSKFCM